MEVPTLGQVVGENLRRVRSEILGRTQAELAEDLADHGLFWSRDAIASLEVGRRTDLDLSEAVLLGHALQVPDAIDELLAGDGPVRLGPHASTDRATVRAVLRGLDEGEVLLSDEAGRRLFARLGVARRPAPDPAEILAAARHDVTPQVVANAARRLWGRSLTEERDARAEEAGPGTAAQRRTRRGHAARTLDHELSVELRRRRTR